MEIPSSVTTPDEQLEYCTRPYGIMRRAVKLKGKWYRNAVGAMIGTLKEDGRAVALIPSKLGGYYMIDAGTGVRKKINSSTAKEFDEDALCFYKPLPLRKLKMRDLMVYVSKLYNAADLAVVCGLMLISTLLGMIMPAITRWLFGSYVYVPEQNIFILIAILAVSSSLCAVMIKTITKIMNSRLNTKQNVAVQAAVMMRILSLPSDFFKNFSAGELAQRLEYINNLCSTVVEIIFGTGLSALFSLAYIFQIAQFTSSLALPAILVILATIIFSIITVVVRTNLNKKHMELSSEENGLTYAMISGVQKIKLAGAEKRMFARWAGHYSEEAALSYNPPHIIKINSAIGLAISLAGTIAIYYIAQSSGISPADYTAFTAAYGVVTGAFSALTVVLEDIASIKPVLELVRPILEAEPEVSSNKDVVTSIAGNIELHNITFRYDENMPPVIDNLSLNIHSGEYVAIVGSTGCGKSTLIRLILGLEKAQKGSIFFDRRDIANMDLKSLRKRIGVVMQDDKLFNDDIYTNIVISAPHLTLDEAWEAAETAQIADDIRNMPMGMFTIIPEGSGSISGGQKQRIMIARAVAPKPKILIFDEATSALDNVTQKKISEAIDSMKCTRIVIAHRLSTIKHCDRIIVLDKGAVIEEGTYDELIAKNGFFAELIEHQRV